MARQSGITGDRAGECVPFSGSIASRLDATWGTRWMVSVSKGPQFISVVAFRCQGGMILLEFNHSVACSAGSPVKSVKRCQDPRTAGRTE
jgi:hypothetical protein